MPKKYKSYLQDQNCDIAQYVRKSENDFVAGTTKFSKYVDYSIYEDIQKIYAYLESKHISGPTDSLGREKPFFNIVLAARNIWYRATDIDRKNIKVRATKTADDIGVFLATVHLQDWMRRVNFGTFLNNWGINSAGFNESVLKFVEQGDQLIPSVVSWNRMICDAIDFKGNPKIEILELTEAQLRSRKSYNQDLVESLCEALTTRKLVDNENQDNKPNYIKLYEVHGQFPKSYLTDDPEDADEYVQQMQVLSFVASSDNDDKDREVWDDYILYRGREAKDPYILSALLPEIDGSIALRGAVKTLFDAQWMQNHSVKSIKDNLDLASKLIYQTSDSTFFGQNVLEAIQNGSILIHKPNEPLSQVTNTTNDIESLKGFSAMWKSLGNEITGISESMLGQTPPSGTAWRQTQALLAESHSLFELMTENKGLIIEEIMREFVFPFLKKKMDTSKEIAATLEAHDIEKIDSRFVKGYSTIRSNRAVKELVMAGHVVTPEQQQHITDQYAEQAKGILEDQGNQRFFAPGDIPDATWKALFKDLEWMPEVDVTNENLDMEAAATLKSVLDFLVAKGNNPLTADEKMVMDKLLQLTGTVSPIELSGMNQQPASKPVNKVSESISYKDAPEDIRRQMEAQAGMTPSQITPQAVPPVAPTPAAPVVPAA